MLNVLMDNTRGLIIMAKNKSNKTNEPVVKTHVPVVAMFTLEQNEAFKKAVEASGMKAAGFVRNAVINFAQTFNVEIPVVEPKAKGRPSLKAEMAEKDRMIAELNERIARILANAGEPDTNVSSR
jgi:hypothetical protein